MKSSVNTKTKRSSNDELARKTMLVVLWAVIIISILIGVLIFAKLYVVMHEPAYETYAISREQFDVVCSMSPTYNVSCASDETYVRPMAFSDSEPDVEQEDDQTLDQIYEELGQDTIEVDGSTLVRFDLPDAYYGECDYSSFQPYMSYKCITDSSTQAYAVSHSDFAYTDDNGMRRYQTADDQFTINGEDDYVFALGTFYKPRGTCGSRWLVITTTGAYTAITGDEKADVETDDLCMFSRHGDDGMTLGLIEWIVDYDLISSEVWAYGSITAGPIEAIHGEILYMYQIQ